ncbi:MAG TPA: hypothetical protein PLM56_11065 [Cyclobacteriaceae bacterium]|nr:hypothetical protein [Cytophagales bacterium]HMR56771.1 hypothetical protein [Cyclobacteriaceae bacterium]HNT51706.1 hypothetical protein [Cyclobacteriaceae bacterium]HRE66244.1 hypothetical protein [Cyclobacteriaceae bacterium]HRF34029.1 hypothetical protein [Cyclobacteriaceae bacterium]
MRIVYILLLLLSVSVNAQQLNVKRVELSGDDIIVHFALLDSLAGRTYSVNLYSSRDNFVNPLTHVTGDMGMDIKPGVELKVVWNAKQELGAAFDDKIAIELRARVYIPFLRFDSFSKIKRGKPTQVTWRGGTPQHILNFELWRKGGRVLTIPNVPNAGHTKLEIPASVKRGKGYTFKIVESRNKDLAIQTQPFAVKPKVPFLIKVLPVLAGGTAIYFLSGGKDKEIPDPIKVPK